MLKLKHSNNIILEYNNESISIDPLRKTNNFEINFITHAHKDHIGPNMSDEKKYFATSSTLEIVNKMYNENKSGKILEYNKKYHLDDLHYKIINSGHVLGSYSLVLEYNGTTITITSDINNIDSTTTKAADIEDTDILIIESTYGTLQDSFPDRKTEYTKFLKWLMLNRLNGKMPIIAAYPLGKTQEIVKLVSDNTNFKIGLTNDAFDITEIYKKYGVDVKNYEQINKNLNDLDLLIMPPGRITKNLIDAIATTCKKSLAFANTSGNKLKFGDQFKISDHCDCNGLLDYIEKSNAKQVYTYHGRDKEFSEIVTKKLGCYSKAFKDIKTLEII